MPEDTVMFFDKPHFVVKLDTSLLKVDLKEGFRRKLEEFAEHNAPMRETIGFLFQTVIPLDVPLKDIDSAMVDSEGRVKVVIPLRRDITIPLEPDESQKLVDKMNELIPIEKTKAAERFLASQEAERELRSREAEAQARLGLRAR
jgi:hypothetical protein